jgi:putative resolvase
MYGTTAQAKEYYSVSTDTLRRWAKSGKIQFQKTKGGHRRYYIPDDEDSECETTGTSLIIYARVSSSKQKTELQNQIDFLAKKYPDHEIIQDIGSGINYNRKGFNTILERLFDGDIEEVVVASRDRFTRFGFELFETIFNRFNARLIADRELEEISDEQELAEDIMSVITVFTARYYGRRRYRSDQISDESESESENQKYKSSKKIKKNNVKSKKVYKEKK